LLVRELSAHSLTARKAIDNAIVNFVRLSRGVPLNQLVRSQRNVSTPGQVLESVVALIEVCSSPLDARIFLNLPVTRISERRRATCT
jgi:hypothetical protein